jgi:hypothetical protein
MNLGHHGKPSTLIKFEDQSTSNAIAHMMAVHQINKQGPIPTRSIESHGGDSQNPIQSTFNPSHFRRLLIKWIVEDNVHFTQVENPRFRELMEYANHSILESGSLPTHATIRRWILKDYNRCKPLVDALLREVDGQVHISFDLWTSNNLLSLIAIVLHYVDRQGKIQTILLGLPELEGSHAGVNIASSVVSIIREFKLESKIGHFVLDNASNNDTCLEQVASELGFDCQERRLRCMGHVINLVVKNLLFGKDPEAFEVELEQPRDEIAMLELWRKKGPIGRLHNIVVHVRQSGQRSKLFKRLQSIDINDVDSEKSVTYELIRDNKTRWNSTYDMIERAVKLRNTIDAYIQTQLQNDPKSSIRHDQLSALDWTNLTEYLSILQPFKVATKSLEGRATGGQFGAIWEVLPAMEFLLEHLEELKQQYKNHPDDHFKIGINLAWQKLDEYYNKTSVSPAYVAAVVLHPALRWQWIKKQWSDWPDWIKDAETEVLKLWQYYKQLPIEDPDTAPEMELSGLQEFIFKGIQEDNEEEDGGEFSTFYKLDSTDHFML